MTNTEIRNRILETADRVVIKRSGEVHAYGKFPHGTSTGWYLVGTIIDLRNQFAMETARAA